MWPVSASGYKAPSCLSCCQPPAERALDLKPGEGLYEEHRVLTFEHVPLFGCCVFEVKSIEPLPSLTLTNLECYHSCTTLLRIGTFRRLAPLVTSEILHCQFLSPRLSETLD